MKNELKHLINEKKYKSIIRCFKGIISPKIVENITFFKNYGRVLNVNNPILFDEKLLILKSREYFKNDLVKQCTDKYAVRQYIESKGLGNILNELIDIGNNTNEIKWDLLPEKFAIKCTHGCGYNIIVRDKNEIDTNLIKEKLEYWLEEDYGVISGEYHYKNMKRKIIVEKYLEGKNNELPIDYKFFCSRGKVICALIIVGRGNKQERIFVDENYNYLNFVNEYSGKDYLSTKPKAFEEMIEISKKLSEDFPFVRVDLYEVNNKVVFGELTFTPHGCMHKYLSEEVQVKIGSKIVL